MKRRLLLFVAAVVLLIAGAALLVHAPFVRARVLVYAVATLEDQYGIRVEAGRLDYNLLALRVGLSNVRVSAAGKQLPFFEADYVAVAVPRRMLFGDVYFDEVAVNNGVVRIVRQASGQSNLPETTGDGTGEPEALRIGRIDLSPLRIDVRDEGSGFALDVPAASVERLTADGGRIVFTQPATVRFEDHGTRITRLESNARFDGRTIYLEGAQVDAEEGQIRLDGPVTVLANDPSLDLRLGGTGDLSRLARWGMAEADAPRGQVAFAGRVHGPMAGPAAALTFTSPRITWQQLTFSNVAADARVTPEALTITRAVAGIQGGHVEVSAEVPFADINAATADARIRLENRPTPFVPVALPGESRLVLTKRSWRLDGQHSVGGVAPATIALNGRLADDLQRSTVTGDVQVADADLPALLGVLRRARLVDVPADSVPEGRIRANAHVSGTFTRIQVELSASSDSLRVPMPQAAGPVTITATFDTGTERYTFDAVMDGWVLTPTTDVPLAGRVNATLRGSGRAAAVMADGRVTAAEVAWQDVAIGDVVATIAADPQLAYIVATIPQFNTTADARVAVSAPYMGIHDSTRRGPSARARARHD